MRAALIAAALLTLAGCTLVSPPGPDTTRADVAPSIGVQAGGGGGGGGGGM